MSQQHKEAPNQVNDITDVPAADCYVVATDRFMSGWGMATGKINILILPCQSVDEAQDVADYAYGRSDTKAVRIVQRELLEAYMKADPEDHLWQLMTPERATAWYRRAPGGVK